MFHFPPLVLILFICLSFFALRFSLVYLFSVFIEIQAAPSETSREQFRLAALFNEDNLSSPFALTTILFILPLSSILNSWCCLSCKMHYLLIFNAQSIIYVCACALIFIVIVHFIHYLALEGTCT